MPERLTDEQLQEIEARANSATPGPWSVTRGRSSRTIHHHPEVAHESTMLAIVEGRKDSDEAEANASLIAAARTDVPALLAEIKELKAELQTAKYVESTALTYGARCEEQREQRESEIKALKRERDEALRKISPDVIDLLEPPCRCGHAIEEHEFIYHPEAEEWHRSHDQPDEIRKCEMVGCTCTEYTEPD